MIRREIPKKTKQIGVRFSEDEKLLVEQFVQDHTQAISVSEWIRELVFGEISRHQGNQTGGEEAIKAGAATAGS